MTTHHRPLTSTRCAAAVALTLMAGAAMAQNLSLSGRVDQSVVKSSPGKWELTHGSANRLIFRGNEDLGDGTKAYFYLQHRFYGDTGAPRSSSQFWYYSYVGLQGGFGDLKLGNQASPIDDATSSDYEIFRGDTVASSVSRIAGGQKIWTNGIDYTTPSMAGFRVHVGTGLGEGVTKTRGQGGSLLYDNKNVSLAVSAQRSPTNVKTVGVGASYKWDALSVMGTWAHSERVTDPKTKAATAEQTDVQLSAGYRIQSGEPRVLYNRSELADVTTRVIGLGYFHYLSKRTALYGAASDTKEESKSSVKAYQVGLRHLF
ncbi:MAG: porin [Rhizobacter sp.]|nr:porin [Rhizobacter sp.]